MKKILNQSVFIIGLIYTILATTYFGLIDKTAQMGLALLTGALLMAFGNLDKIARFKGAGFEAEMKQKIDEASATLSNLQDLAIALIEPILSILTSESVSVVSGRLQDKLDKRDEIVKFLEELSISSSKINELADFFDSRIIRSKLRALLSSAIGPMGMLMTLDPNNPTRRELERLNTIEDPNLLIKLDVQELRRLLKDVLEKRSYVENNLLDLEYFIKYRQLRTAE